MRKYKLKKNTYINWIIVLICLMIALVLVNIGYSLWSTKLNIFGKVTLDLNVPHLEVTVPKVNSESYVTLSENSGFTLIKDEYVDNILTTTIRANEMDSLEKIRLSFSMKNISKMDEVYVDGKVMLVEQTSNIAISNALANVATGVIENGKMDTFNFIADIDKDILDSSAYYKYEITYTTNGIKKNFYYIINILPKDIY